MLAALVFALHPSGIVIEGHRDASEAVVSASAMRYIPFDVPEGVTRITIHKDLDHGSDAKPPRIVDHGLFDPRGLDGKGFRGWMGGNSADIVLSGDAGSTSSWYIPGPLPAGRWNLAQYYLQATPHGLDYRYTITFDFSGPRPPDRPLLIPRYRPGTVRTGTRWWIGNTHAHTSASDGAGTLFDLAHKCRAEGFDFLIPTEHNTIRSQFDFAAVARQVPDLLLIEGDEFTSPFGHANVLGSRPGAWFDFRFDSAANTLGERPPGMNLSATIREAHRQRALFVVNHPNDPCTTCLWRYLPEEWSEADGIEVWNGTWDLFDEMTLRQWDEQLRKGRKIWAFGGSDYHRGEGPMIPATSVYASDLSRNSILDGMRKGRITLLERGSMSALDFRVGNARPGSAVKRSNDLTAEVDGQGMSGLMVRVLSDHGVVAEVVWPVDQTHLEFPLGDAVAKRSYVRLEVRRGGSRGSMVALTNPVFVK